MRVRGTVTPGSAGQSGRVSWSPAREGGAARLNPQTGEALTRDTSLVSKHASQTCIMLTGTSFGSASCPEPHPLSTELCVSGWLDRGGHPVSSRLTQWSHADAAPSCTSDRPASGSVPRPAPGPLAAGATPVSPRPY